MKKDLSQIRQAEYIGATDSLEAEISETWRKSLGVGKVGVDDDFFQIGGHSLLWMKNWSWLVKRYSLSIPDAELDKVRTVRNLAAYLRENHSEALKASAGKSLPKTK